MSGGWFKKGEKKRGKGNFNYFKVASALAIVLACMCFVFSSFARAGINVPSETQKAASALNKAPAPSETGNVAENVAEQKININKADKETLLKIKGLGPTKAQNIIDYRNKFGPFKKYEDLLKVKGIGEKTLELIKPFITL